MKRNIHFEVNVRSVVSFEKAHQLYSITANLSFAKHLTFTSHVTFQARFAVFQNCFRIM